MKCPACNHYNIVPPVKAAPAHRPPHRTVYHACVRQLSEHYDRSPELLSFEEVRQLHPSQDGQESRPPNCHPVHLRLQALASRSFAPTWASGSSIPRRESTWCSRNTAGIRFGGSMPGIRNATCAPPATPSFGVSAATSMSLAGFNEISNPTLASSARTTRVKCGGYPAASNRNT
jgi:hypothetical protein